MASRVRPEEIVIVVITVSDRASSGTYVDESGPAAIDTLAASGFTDVALRVIPDGRASVADALRDAVDGGARVILTLGGTGLGPRDETPEGTRAVITAEVPGVAEALRARGLQATPTAALSRGIAGVVTTGSHRAFVANLPGSPRAVTESLEVLTPLLGHIASQLAGGDHA